MDPRATHVAFAIIAGLAVPTIALSGVIPLSQLRSVSALATASSSEGFDSSSDAANFFDLGPFNDSFSFDAEIAGATASGQAILGSNIVGASLFAGASFTSTAAIENDDEFAEAFGRGFLSYDFRLTETTPFSLVGQLQSSGNGVTVFQLNGPFGNIFSFIPDSDDVLAFNESGLLEPGDYDIFLSTTGFGQATPVSTTPASGSYYVTFDLDATVSVPSAPNPVALRVTPNPMQRATTIQLPLVQGGRDLEVTVHTAGGRAVRTLRGAAGEAIVWDARNESGVDLPAGVYFLHVDGDRSSRATRVTLLR